MTERLEPGHVVEDFYIGKTHIMICDDYCRNKSKEEIENTLNRIAAIALQQFQLRMGITSCNKPTTNVIR